MRSSYNIYYCHCAGCYSIFSSRFTMGNYSWCIETNNGNDDSLYRLNITASRTITALSVCIISWYNLASFLAYRSWTMKDRNHRIFKSNLLSGLLVSMVTISVIKGTYPQAIEATCVVVLALSQASAPGWVDFGPDVKKRDIIYIKVPDLVALGLNLWVLKDAHEKSSNSDDSNETALSKRPWLPFMFCSVANEIIIVLLYGVWRLKHQSDQGKSFSSTILEFLLRIMNRHCWVKESKGLLLWCTVICCGLFICSSVAGAALGMFFAHWSCKPFKPALIMASIAVTFGAIYSVPLLPILPRKANRGQEQNRV